VVNITDKGTVMVKELKKVHVNHPDNGVDHGYSKQYVAPAPYDERDGVRSRMMKVELGFDVWSHETGIYDCWNVN
jgi:hypothetical protein